MGDSGGDKTEQPTSHKLREAAKKGQTVKSKEVTTAFLFMTSYYILRSNIKHIWENVTNYFIMTLSSIGGDISFNLVCQLLRELVTLLLLSIMPLILTNLILAIIIEALQTGFNMTIDPLMPKLSKLNPIEGLKRMFSIKGLVELAKSMAKMFIIFSIMRSAILPVMPDLLRMGSFTVLGALGIIGTLAFNVATRVGLFYAFIALLDYFWQRQQFMKQMRMSKQEIKDEYKKLEGDPHVKQRQRDMGMQLRQGRRGGGAAGADAVVTNPTHIAVAIKYDAEIMQAPTVLAKGKMLHAEEIKRIAEENQVFIIENKELARELFASTEVGQEVPPQLYSGVAEILAMVYEIKQKRKNRKAA